MTVKLHEDLPVKRIVVSGNNPRTVNTKTPEFIKLVESVKARGVIVPVHVRVHPKRKDKFELLAGERRWRACQAAKVARIRAIDHGAISDADAFEVTFNENFCREDLTVIEEGKAAALLLDKYKGDAKAVAAKLGRSERWVFLRACIHTSLAESWQKQIVAAEGFEKWTAGHLARIARFPANVQAALLKKVGKGWPWNRCHEWTIDELDKHCSEELMLLARAPFDTSPASKCAKCPKRSSRQPTLWAEKTTEVSVGNDRCLDRKCWDKREASACKRLVRQTQAKYDELVLVSNAKFFNEDSGRLKRLYGKYLSAGDFSIAKKTSKGAKPALVIAGRDKGKVRYIKVNPTKALTPAKKHKPTATELKIQAERQRWLQVQERFDERLAKIAYSEIPGAKVGAVCLLATLAGADPVTTKDDLKAFGEKIARAQKAGPANVLDVLLEQLYGAAKSAQDFGGYSSDPERIRTELELLGPTFGIDVQAIYDDVMAEEKAAERDTKANTKSKGQDAKHRTNRAA